MQDSFWDRPNGEILADYVSIRSVNTGATARSAAANIRTALKRYVALVGGHEPPLRTVVTSVPLLSDVMANVYSLRTERPLSVKTLVQVRFAFRNLAAAVPPPPGYTRAELRAVFDEARRGGEEYAGQRRRLAVGNREKRDKYIPTEEQIRRLVDEFRSRGGDGPTYADLTIFLRLTGIRVGAALAMRVADLQRMPDGTVWAPIHEKSRPDRRVTLVPPSQSALVGRWMSSDPEAFLWARPNGRAVDRRAYYSAMTNACDRLCMPRFSPHALRARAGRALTVGLGLGRAMDAIGWQSSEAPERYYLSPQNTDDDSA